MMAITTSSSTSVKAGGTRPKPRNRLLLSFLTPPWPRWGETCHCLKRQFNQRIRSFAGDAAAPLGSRAFCLVTTRPSATDSLSILYSAAH